MKGQRLEIETKFSSPRKQGVPPNVANFGVIKNGNYELRKTIIFLGLEQKKKNMWVFEEQDKD